MSSHTRTISNRIIGTFLLFLISFSLASILVFPATVAAAGESELGKIETRLQVPIPLLTTAAGNITITSRTLAEYIIRIYNFLLMAATVLATVMLVWGGFMWMTAGGGAERVGKAQEYIGNAIAGLIILFGAYLILSIVNPSLTTLKDLKLQPIKPIATGFFCDERLADNRKLKGSADNLEFFLLQKRGEEVQPIPQERFTEDPTLVIRDRDPKKDWIYVNETYCGSVYAVSEVRGRQRTKAGGAPCFGRTGCPAGKMCSQTPGGPQCVTAVAQGSITKPQGRGVDYIRIYEVRAYDSDRLLAGLNTSPNDSSYKIAGLNESQILRQGYKHYISIEINGGEWWDNDYYIGKGAGNTTGRRISFGATDNECFVVTNATEKQKTKVSCDTVLWTNDEIRAGIQLDLDISDQDIYGKDLGE